MKRWVPNGIRHLYEFGEFQLDPDRHRLLRDGQLVPLPPRAIDLLILFVRNPGKALERQALLEAIWTGAIVEDANLTVAISHLRKALGQNAGPAEFIETIPRIGYRFVADPREVVEEHAPLTTQRPRQPLTITEEEIETPATKASNGAHPAAERVPNEPEALVAADKIGASSRTKKQALVLLALLALGVVGFLIYWRTAARPGTSAAPVQMKSIAVLPFQSLGRATPEDEYLALGLADALSSRLSRLKQFVVRPTSSVLKFSGAAQEPVEAGRALGVDGVIDGLVQHDQDRVRLTTHLLRVSDGAVLWTDSFNERFTSLFEVEDVVSQHVVKALQLKLTTAEEQDLVRQGTRNSEAFGAYLRGRYAWNKRTTENTKKALQFFQEAIELDPAYAAAYAGLADCYLALGDYGDASPNESFPRARGAALRALEIDDSLAEAHASLAQTRFLFDWDWAGAEREYLRAIELKPNYATAHHWYAMFLAGRGRSEEAMREIKRAEDLDPLSLIIRANIGTIHYFARDYDRAIAQEQKVLEADSGFIQARRKLAFALEAAGKDQETVAEWLRVEQQLGASEATLAAYRSAAAASGLTGYWLQAIEVEKKESGGEAGALSSYYARLGETEQALHWLERAIDQRAPWLVYAKVTPVYDNLRGDLRFGALLQRLGQ
ncbi:MAG: tetratricopeptide repeat protein [Chthoniobacterales bacterium]|nr:tetratricopeptide repeat protein [Chthoniobacterales bacterium]